MSKEISEEIQWFRCEKCGERLWDHTIASGGKLVCPEPKLADVVPIETTNYPGDPV